MGAETLPAGPCHPGPGVHGLAPVGEKRKMGACLSVGGRGVFSVVGPYQMAGKRKERTLFHPDDSNKCQHELLTRSF